MEPFIGQIMMFGGNFAPRGWAFCDGQLLSIAQFSALFSILGTTYGGDGQTTFALPDLRGRVPLHPGNGPGLTPRQLGARSGSETNTLNVTQIPSHSHPAVVRATSDTGDERQPGGHYLASANDGENNYAGASANLDSQLDAGAVVVGDTGGNVPVNNLQPYLAVSFIIALEGIYPSRN